MSELYRYYVSPNGETLPRGADAARAIFHAAIQRAQEDQIDVASAIFALAWDGVSQDRDVGGVQLPSLSHVAARIDRNRTLQSVRAEERDRPLRDSSLRTSQAIACRREAVVLHVILTTQRDHLSPGCTAHSRRQVALFATSVPQTWPRMSRSRTSGAVPDGDMALTPPKAWRYPD